MKNYLVYFECDGHESYFLCEAENMRDAIEQMEQAHDRATVLAVYRAKLIQWFVENDD